MPATRKLPLTRVKYNAVWPYKTPDIQIEMACIRMGGSWKNRRRQDCGNGLPFHHCQLQKMLWPHLDDHRWHQLCQKTIGENQVTVLMGPASSTKTHESSKFALCEYFSSPEDTTILVSSTTLPGLELRVWGEIKKLYTQAKNRFDWLPGHLIDSKHCISTDDIQEEDVVRDLRNGIVGVPCVVNNRYTGLDRYVGIKNKKVRLIADECQFLPASFLEAVSNLEKNPDFKAVFLGNPLDTMDSLGKAAEPLDGWASVGEPEKTTVWTTRYKNGKCVNLVGTDSPNFDYPPEDPPRFPYMIHRGSIASTESFYGKDSLQYYSQCKGVMKSGLISRRVINQMLCRKFNAHDPAVWGMEFKRTRIYGLDAAYGNIGGDRCVGGFIDFGKDIEGKTVVEVHPPQIVPVSVRNERMAEDQIAEYVRNECENAGIPPECVFYDSTGRGSLGTSFARIWSAYVNPVEFGGNPTNRPVCQDMYIVDPKTKARRLKLCSEHFSKFVTELWFSVRYVIEAGQMRSLPKDVMEEGCMREWKMVRGSKIEIETKDEMKLRMGRSPDLFDWCFEGETLISTPSGKTRIEDLNPGDWVLTPMGPTRIAFVSKSQINLLTRAEFSNGAILSGRGEHKVFTWDRGWVKLDSLSIDNECETVDGLPLWQLLSTLFTREESSSFKAQVDTIRMAVTGRLRKRDFFTGLSGLSTMGLFLKVCASITRMMIGETTIQAILNWWNSRNTQGITSSNDCLIQKPKLTGPETTPRLSSLPPFGTALQKGGNGTVKTPEDSGGCSINQSHAPALCVEMNSSHHSQTRHFTVQPDASANTPSRRLFQIIAFVLSAAKSLWRTNIGPRRIAPVIVRQSQLQESRWVYNLTLENHNVYYANGILVQNCATCIEGARRRGFQIGKLAIFEDSGSNLRDWAQKQTKKMEAMNTRTGLVFSV